MKPANKGHATVITHRPEIRLMRLARRKGGLSREEAVAQAEQYVEELRGISMTSIDNLIAGLEALCAASEKHQFIDLREVRRRTDQIINLAGTFSLQTLVTIAKMLSDIASAFELRSIGEIEPITVHVSALRLLSPSAPPVPSQIEEAVLGELGKVARHFGVTPQVEVEDWLVEYVDDRQKPEAVAGSYR